MSGDESAALLGMSETIGEHGGRLKALEGRMREQVIATQENGRKMETLSSDVKTLAATVEKSGNGTARKSVWPKDVNGWIGFGVKIFVGIVFVMGAGVWLADRGLFPGHEDHVGGIEVNAAPLDSGLADEIRALRNAIEGSSKADLDGFPNIEMAEGS